MLVRICDPVTGRPSPPRPVLRKVHMDGCRIDIGSDRFIVAGCTVNMVSCNQHQSGSHVVQPIQETATWRNANGHGAGFHRGLKFTILESNCSLFFISGAILCGDDSESTERLSYAGDFSSMTTAVTLIRSAFCIRIKVRPDFTDILKKSVGREIGTSFAFIVFQSSSHSVWNRDDREHRHRHPVTCHCQLKNRNQGNE